MNNFLERLRRLFGGPPAPTAKKPADPLEGKTLVTQTVEVTNGINAKIGWLEVRTTDSEGFKGIGIGHGTEVYFDGKQLPHVKSIDIHIDAKEARTAKLELYV